MVSLSRSEARFAHDLGDGSETDGLRRALWEVQNRRDRTLTQAKVQAAVEDALEAQGLSGAQFEAALADAAQWLAAEWARSVDRINGARLVPDADGGYRLELQEFDGGGDA